MLFYNKEGIQRELSTDLSTISTTPSKQGILETSKTGSNPVTPIIRKALNLRAFVLVSRLKIGLF